MRDLMRDGKISGQPELLDKDGRAVKVDALAGGASAPRRSATAPPDEAIKAGAELADGVAGKKKKKDKKGKKEEAASKSIADQDDFFETD